MSGSSPGATLDPRPGTPPRPGALSSVPGGPFIETPAPQGSFARTLALVVATGGGAGFSPVASGTAGAAVGVLLFGLLRALVLPLYAVTAVGTVCLGIWAADEAERHWGRKDDGRIVIDEIAGQLIALLPLLPLGRAGSLGWVVTGFVAFRVFDVWKPGPARWLEQNLSGGAGVVMDDVAAGAFAALLLAVLVAVFG